MTYEEAVAWIVKSRQFGFRPRAVAISPEGARVLSEDPRVLRWEHHLTINYDGEDVGFAVDDRPPRWPWSEL